MKPLNAAIIVSLAFLLVGCAKNSDVEKIQSRIKELESQQSAASELRNKLNAAEAELVDLQREVERLKIAESQVADAAHRAVETVADTAKEGADAAKQMADFEFRLSKTEIRLDGISSVMDAMTEADRVDPLRSFKLEQRLEETERKAESLRAQLRAQVDVFSKEAGRLDDVVAILKMPPGPMREAKLNALR